MSFGLVMSVLLHVGILGWALIGFNASKPLIMPEEIPVEVSIISAIDLELRQKKGDSLSKIEEAAQSAGKAPSPKDAPKPKPVRAVEPPPSAEPPPPAAPPEPVKVEPPPPAPEPPKPDQIAALIEKAPPPPTPEGPTPDDQKKLEEKLAEQQRQEEARKAAAAQKLADEKKKADDQKRADDLAKKKLADDKKKKDDAAKKAADLLKKKQFDGAKIAELLNKVPDQPSAAAGADAPPSKPTTAKGPTAGTKTGTDNVNKARAEQMLVALLNSAFKECWSKPLAGGGVSAPAVKLKWTLNPDGTLSGEPKIIQSDRGNPLAEQAERAAIRAVQTCVPFQLPPDQYAVWREITWNFNPDQAL